MNELRLTTLLLLDEAVAAGCRLSLACREMSSTRGQCSVGAGRATGARTNAKGPARRRSRSSLKRRGRPSSRRRTRRFRDLSPKQIVPRLADRGQYLASESTFYRVLRAEGLMAHRGPSKPRTVRRPEELVATGPNEVWSWDITYLPTQVRGTFFYLYLFVDVWSRRIMKAVVLREESADNAARLLADACMEHQVQHQILTLHSDNGSPMKGSTMLATMQALGVVPSFSRPSVSNDNPYSEALFRTLKYVPSYPRKPFESIDAAWAWVERFVAWYNCEHRHSGIGFVAPDERHQGHDVRVLLARRTVYAAARRRHPARWSRHARQWNAPATVSLNLRDRQTSARAAETLRIGATPTTSMVPAHALRTSIAPLRHHAESTSPV